MLRIRYLSDLHLEFIAQKQLPSFLGKIHNANKDDICICAGDIGNPYLPSYQQFFQHMSATFPKTFVVPGNHEYYGNRINDTRIFIGDHFKQYNNISLLDNAIEVYQNHTFIGTTLWSYVADKSYEINDVEYIKNFNTDKYNELHQESVRFLSDSLSANNNIVVITHHLPSYQLIDVKYNRPSYRGMNQWFASNQDLLFTQYNGKIKAWFYGHTHTPSQRKLQGIDFYCNPIGYPGENKFVDFNKVAIIQ